MFWKKWGFLWDVSKAGDFSQNLRVVLALLGRKQLCCGPFARISLTAVFPRIKFKQNHSFLFIRSHLMLLVTRHGVFLKGPLMLW